MRLFFLFLLIFAFGTLAPASAHVSAASSTYATATDWPVLTWTEYSNPKTHAYPVNSSTVSAKVASLEALPDTEAITVQHYNAYGVLTLTDVYTRETQGSEVWVHTSY